jgi:calcineurin-like phosphoesterase family protein
MPFVRKFYVSDTHFGHTNILAMQPRNFRDIETHDEHLIDRWNSVVGDEDIVYHLGDFAMALHERAERVRWIFSRLRGRKFLIVGNHDVDRSGNVHQTLLSLEWEEPPTGFRFTDDGGRRVVMAHYAQRSWQHQLKGSVHFFGHSHGHLPGEGLSRDVGVDMPDVAYMPRTFDELTKNWRLK